MTELKPCPFCGSNYAVTANYLYSPVTIGCGMCGTHVEFRGSSSDAIKAWNTRHSTDVIELLKVAVCPACDGSGGIPVQVADDEWEQEQCQWCFERNLILGDTNETLSN